MGKQWPKLEHHDSQTEIKWQAIKQPPLMPMTTPSISGVHKGFSSHVFERTSWPKDAGSSDSTKWPGHDYMRAFTGHSFAKLSTTHIGGHLSSPAFSPTKFPIVTQFEPPFWEFSGIGSLSGGFSEPVPPDSFEGHSDHRTVATYDPFGGA